MADSIEYPNYNTNLTNHEWDMIATYFEDYRSDVPQGAPRRWEYRILVNAVLYKNDNGCKWRALPKDFGPSWITVYKFFSACQRKGIWEKVHDVLRGECRRLANMPESPSTARIDSQTAKSMLKKTKK